MLRFFYFINLVVMIGFILLLSLDLLNMIYFSSIIWKIWTLVFTLNGIFLLYFSKRKWKSNKKLNYDDLIVAYEHEIEKNEQFKKEVQKVFKTHLKVSILFWMFYYRKEKMKPFQDAKKDIFKSLNREFSSVSWMHELLGNLNKELEKYNRS